MIFSWGDGRALAALIGKFRSDLVDYISLCSMGDPERMIDVSSFCDRNMFRIYLSLVSSLEDQIL